MLWVVTLPHDDSDHVRAISIAVYGASSPRHDSVAVKICSALLDQGYAISHVTESNVVAALFVLEREYAKVRGQLTQAQQERDVAEQRYETEHALRTGGLR